MVETVEEDHEELLQYSDEDSGSDTEENCFANDGTQTRPTPLTFFPQTATEFLTNVALLLVASCLLLLILPLYISAVNVRGSVYSIMAFNIPLSTLVLALIVIGMKYILGKFTHRSLLRPPIGIQWLLYMAFIYIVCGYLYMYASDRNKVLCHLQDPIKGIILVFALLCYFFFCRNLMGLQRIFSATTVIVGLFIAVDYGLCDEFVCRGYDRKEISDDTGNWSWKIHSIWTGIYILSLMMFVAFYTWLDRFMAPDLQLMSSRIVPQTFLTTISRSIGLNPSNTDYTQTEQTPESRPIYIPNITRKSSIHLSLWIHVFVLAFMLCTSWIDLIPGIGKGEIAQASLNYTIEGIKCHFNLDSPECHNVLWYAIIFQLAYITFTISSIKSLILSQSAVFTIAVMTSALPVAGIFWSIFQATPAGLIEWAPKLRAEFICSIIGTVVVFIGLGLLIRAHFGDIYNRRGECPHCA